MVDLLQWAFLLAVWFFVGVFLLNTVLPEVRRRRSTPGDAAPPTRDTRRLQARAVIQVSTCLWLLSLCLPALSGYGQDEHSPFYDGKASQVRGLTALVFGATSLWFAYNGGDDEAIMFIGWTANVSALAAAVLGLLRISWKGVALFGSLAFLLGLAPLLVDLELLSGYFVWMASFVLLAAVGFVEARPERQSPGAPGTGSPPAPSL